MGWLQTWIPRPIAFNLGDISVEWYGIIVAIAALAGFLVARKLLHKKQVSDDHVFGLLFWLLLSTLIGGRIGHIIGEWQHYSQQWGEAIKIWNGGLAIHGALMAGGIAIYIYAKVTKRSFGSLLDPVLVVVPLMQALGRWGNYFNQELFGRPTELPWGIPISYASRPTEFMAQTHFHPLFLYESLLMALLFLVLYRLYDNDRLSVGQYALLYLLVFSVMRFFLDFLRIDMLEIGPLLLTQWLSIVMIIIAGWLWRRLAVKNT